MNVELLQDYDPETGEGPKAGTIGTIQETYKGEKDGDDYYDVLFDGFLSEGPYYCKADILKFDEDPEPVI
ncbi:hypothetical protein PBI_MIMI_114 [Arthrobacter phage Mimi]|nr:hypothetical protein PBI_MIMI_194 [Arthrobacter phage Mimi]